MSTVETVENCNEPLHHAFSREGEHGEPLDITVECGFDGTVQEITLTVSTGGPHIEIELSSAVVQGYWGGDSHRAPIFENEWVCKDAFEYYARMFEENVVQK